MSLVPEVSPLQMLHNPWASTSPMTNITWAIITCKTETEVIIQWLSVRQCLDSIMKGYFSTMGDISASESSQD